MSQGLECFCPSIPTLPFRTLRPSHAISESFCNGYSDSIIRCSEPWSLQFVPEMSMFVSTTKSGFLERGILQAAAAGCQGLEAFHDGRHDAHHGMPDHPE